MAAVLRLCFLMSGVQPAWQQDASVFTSTVMRRIRLALVMLHDDSRSLAQLSLDLGFSSQSHFTRLFSGLTGMSPGRFQRQCARSSKGNLPI